MYGTQTITPTFTVVDIRKTFEGFDADFRMIAARTGKMTTAEVDEYLNDILAWAEAKHLRHVDITLLNGSDKPVKASRFTIAENGTAVQSARAGGNDWQNIPGTRLTVIVSQKSSWNDLTQEQRDEFKKKHNFKISWGPTQIDTSYSHLAKDRAQLYASNGYELQKENFK